MANSGAGWYEWRRGRPPVRRSGGRVVSALFFFPRGGSAQVARALCRALPTIGWEVSLAAGSLGSAGEQGHAPSFFSGVDVVSVDYSPARRLADPTAALGWSRRLGALLLPARRLGAGRARRPLPRVAHHRLGGVARRRLARERR